MFYPLGKKKKSLSRSLSESPNCKTSPMGRSGGSPQIMLNTCSLQLDGIGARELRSEYVDILKTYFPKWSVIIFLSLICSGWNWKGNKNVDQYVVRVQGKNTEIVLCFFFFPWVFFLMTMCGILSIKNKLYKFARVSILSIHHNIYN